MTRRSPIVLIAIALLGICISWRTTLAADLPPGPIAYWKFDEGSGDIAYDSSGNGHDATLHGDPDYGPGRFNSALSLDGHGDYADLHTDPSPFYVNELTLCAWIKLDPQWNGNGRIVCKHYDEQGHGYALGVTAGRYLFAVLEGQTHTSQTRIPLETWTHVAVAARAWAQKAFLYIDGELEGTYTHYGSIHPSGYPLRIGRQSQRPDEVEPFQGLIDELKIYHCVRAKGEILQDAMLDGLPVAHWRFDEEAETSLTIPQAAAITASSSPTPLGFLATRAPPLASTATAIMSKSPIPVASAASAVSPSPAGSLPSPTSNPAPSSASMTLKAPTKLTTHTVWASLGYPATRRSFAPPSRSVPRPGTMVPPHRQMWTGSSADGITPP